MDSASILVGTTSNLFSPEPKHLHGVTEGRVLRRRLSPVPGHSVDDPLAGDGEVVRGDRGLGALPVG